MGEDSASLPIPYRLAGRGVGAESKGCVASRHRLREPIWAATPSGTWQGTNGLSRPSLGTVPEPQCLTWPGTKWLYVRTKWGTSQLPKCTHAKLLPESGPVWAAVWIQAGIRLLLWISCPNTTRPLRPASFLGELTQGFAFLEDTFVVEVGSSSPIPVHPKGPRSLRSAHQRPLAVERKLSGDEGLPQV